MQFSVGDKLMHPQYGPGEITAMENRELMEGFKHYYVIELIMDGSTLYVPMRKMDELGMRPVMSRVKLAQVLATLRSMPRRLSKDFKERQGRIREKLASARPIKLAEAVRDLTGRRRRSRLTKVDKALLNRGRELLAAEMAMVTGTDILYAHETIDAALGSVIARESDESRQAQVSSMALASTPKTLVHKLFRRDRRDKPVVPHT